VSKDLAIKYWNTHFQTMIDEKAAATDTIPSAWRAGGRATKAYPEKENDIWWQDNGPKMVDNFIQWWRNNKWSVWNHNGVLQVEPEYNVMFGDILVKSFIDLVAVTPDGDIAIIDYKSGVYMPDTNMQLGLYACAVQSVTGIRPTKGYFYNARQGTMEDAGDLSRWTVQLFTELFAQFEKGIQAEIFLPNLGMMCKSCSVKDYCHAYGGELAVKLDPLATL
jgi:RecB family exonuclease